MRVVVLSDTHLRDPRVTEDSLGLPPGARAALDGADLILHCGDLVDHSLLTGLARFAPVHAVLGNNDVALRGRLPEQLVVTADGVRIGMVHDSGPTKGRAARLRRRFPDCAAVVFGHSHAPLSEAGSDGQWLCNPGSPTQRRRAPGHTFAVLDLTDGQFLRARILDADPA